MQLKQATNLKSKICERLKMARIAAGFSTAKEFAIKNELKISTYNLHEAGTRSMAFEVLEHYSLLLKINVTWLLTGVGPKNSTQIRNIPIIAWEEVLSFPHDLDLDSKPWTSSDLDLSPASFALTVDNDAMEPRYPEGTIILIDTLLKPKNKDFAIICLKEKKVPLFKQIIHIDDEVYAKSLNPDYKSLLLSKQTQIIGKVVQANYILSPA